MKQTRRKQENHILILVNQISKSIHRIYQVRGMFNAKSIAHKANLMHQIIVLEYKVV